MVGLACPAQHRENLVGLQLYIKTIYATPQNRTPPAAAARQVARCLPVRVPLHKPGEFFKLADGIADALQTLPSWDAPLPGSAPSPTGFRLAIAEPNEGSSAPPKTIPDQALYLQVSGSSCTALLSLAATCLPV